MPNRVWTTNLWGHSALSISAGNVTPFSGLVSANYLRMWFTASAVSVRLDGVTAHSGTGFLFGTNTAFEWFGDLSKVNIICTGPTGFIQASWGAVG